MVSRVLFVFLIVKSSGHTMNQKKKDDTDVTKIATRLIRNATVSKVREDIRRWSVGEMMTI